MKRTLGSWLLRGLSRRKVRPARRPARRTRRKIVGSAPAPETAPPASPAPIPVTRAMQTGTAYLTSADLTRPDGRLRQSIEAFLLDQRSPHTRRSYGKDL